MAGYGGYDSATQMAGMFQGGGFMPSPADPGLKTAGTPSATIAKKSGSTTLRALTVKQLQEGTSTTVDDQYMLDNEPIQDVVLIGKIARITHEALHIQLVVDDGTGKVNVRHWLDDDDNVATSEWRTGTYVRVHGHLRTFDGQISFQAFKMKPITDFNEVTYHFLSCIFQHLDITRGKGQGPGGLAMPLQTNKGNVSGGYGALSGTPAGGMMGGLGIDGLNPCQSAVLVLLGEPAVIPLASGLSIAEMVGRLNGRFQEFHVRQAIDFLVNEGHIYSTCDEEHYRRAEH